MTENEFTVSTYAQEKVEILEEKKALQMAIVRAENSSPNEVIVSKVHNITGKSFLDETRQVLHIGLEKKQAQNATIIVEVIT